MYYSAVAMMPGTALLLKTKKICGEPEELCSAAMTITSLMHFQLGLGTEFCTEKNPWNRLGTILLFCGRKCSF
jgi:hypothetical protein